MPSEPQKSWFPSRRRLALLVGSGLLLFAVALCYCQFWLARPIGSGPAGPSISPDPFQQPWSERKVLLVGIGDSITAGLGARGVDHSYFARLAANPPDEFPEMQGLCLSAVLPNLTSLNIAVSGSTSIEHHQTLGDKLPMQETDVFGLAVITTGGNDLIHSYGRAPAREGAMYGADFDVARPWIANFEKRLNEMLDLIEARFPGGCEIFLADIYDPTDGIGDAPSVWLPHWPDGLAIHAAYNDVLHRAAETRDNVHAVPLHKTFLGHGSHCRQFWRSTYQANDPHYWFYDNIEDPNDRGYDAIRRVFLNAIAAEAERLKASP